ncbi:putative bifunctional diguanylate cyclase/phosphodiesterase [Paenibacillus methanolicus]|uniref:Diguanylate cyclase (GGDEF)-like protein n=1 Tax=Paenibacillus methanolicus TaxID=582686 RepID=A0A5S5C588_9BACL|nr:bifunctional diguanylate cyclase/phosphodiesterase [Paenibacillus methanolicus]TYP74605.1 diguanylate cyclase (GGDEF)-like protein [Paenibacillus methanolicus]
MLTSPFRNPRAWLAASIVFMLIQLPLLYGLTEDSLLHFAINIAAPAVASLMLLHGGQSGALHRRVFWRLLGIGTLIYAAAWLLRLLFHLTGGVPSSPNPIDYLWNIQGLLYIVAFCYLLLKEWSYAQGTRFLLDCAIMILLLGTIVWEYVLEPHITTLLAGQPWSVIFVSAFYPVADFVMICFLLLVLYSQRIRFPAGTLALLGIGLACFWAADCYYLNMIVSQENYSAGSPVNALYSAALLFIGVSALYARGDPAVEPAEPGARPGGIAANKWLLVLLPYVSIFALVIVILFKREQLHEMKEMLVVGSLIAVLTVIRQIMVILENEALIRQKEHMLAETEFLAHYDTLSRLPNRNFFEKKLSEGYEAERPFAILLIDLNRFKYVNDTYGLHIGDDVIRATAARLQSLVDTDSLLIARQGGDEFSVLVRGGISNEGIEAVAEACIGVLSEPFRLGSLELRITASIGIARAPYDGGSSSQLLRSAHMALIKAKSRGLSQYGFYQPEMAEATAKKTRMEQMLRQALEKNELLLHYQPQICAQTQALVGAEVLVRWQPAGQPMVSPAQFIPLAEETGLIIPIGEWIFRRACEQYVKWRAQGMRDILLSVNVSPHQIEEADFVERFVAIIEETGIDASRVVLEITESLAIQEGEDAIRKLKTLKQRGLQVSMDDFGTGYSSLGVLKLYQVDSLKIAREFIRDLTDDHEQRTIVNAILAMAASMKLKVIAEGVETKEQFDHLRLQGCDWIQGFYFSKPLSAEDFARFAGGGRLFVIA